MVPLDLHVWVSGRGDLGVEADLLALGDHQVVQGGHEDRGRVLDSLLNLGLLRLVLLLNMLQVNHLGLSLFSVGGEWGKNFLGSSAYFSTRELPGVALVNISNG